MSFTTNHFECSKEGEKTQNVHSFNKNRTQLKSKITASNEEHHTALFDKKNFFILLIPETIVFTPRSFPLGAKSTFVFIQECFLRYNKKISLGRKKDEF